MIRFFNFNFLQKVDRYLLLNHTLIWNIKIHYILFYGLIINITLFCFLFFYSLKLYDIYIIYYTLLIGFSFLSLGTLFYWVYQQTYYIPSIEYARIKINGLYEYLLNFISVLLILLPLATINTTIQSKYQYDRMCLLNESSFSIPYKNVLELNKLNKLNIDKNTKITFIEKEEILKNCKMINDWTNFPLNSFYLSLVIFIPLLLMIYQTISSKDFLKSFIWLLIPMGLYAILVGDFYRLFGIEYFTFLIYFIFIFLSFFFFFKKPYSLIFFSNIFLTFISIFTITVNTNKNILISFSHYLIFLSSFFFDSRLITFNIISFTIIVIFIIFVKEYATQYKSIPKN